MIICKIWWLTFSPIFIYPSDFLEFDICLKVFMYVCKKEPYILRLSKVRDMTMLKWEGEDGSCFKATHLLLNFRDFFSWAVGCFWWLGPRIHWFCLLKECWNMRSCTDVTLGVLVILGNKKWVYNGGFLLPPTVVLLPGLRTDLDLPGPVQDHSIPHAQYW